MVEPANTSDDAEEGQPALGAGIMPGDLEESEAEPPPRAFAQPRNATLRDGVLPATLDDNTAESGEAQ